MTNPAELREQLSAAGIERVKARGKARAAERELARLLKAAKESSEVTMTEAVELAGVGRVMAYKLIREKAA